MTDPHEALHEALGHRYEIQEVLGEGGMGTVYLARDRKHDRRVAIKTIPPERTSAEVRQRFQREIGITARLQHPHILPLLDSGAAGETLYYVMPYVDGESLQSRLERDGRLSIDKAIPIARDVAEALQHAHEHDVVHRDIKPSNIMLTGGHAVVTDFGIAKAMLEAEGGQVTQTGFAIGSPAYMSLEQATGDRPVDGRSDIYSLGCVLYEMLTGKAPFSGRTPLEVIARSMREKAPSVRGRIKGVSPALEEVVHRAMAKVPERRFRTADAFAKALSEAQSVAVEKARPPRAFVRSLKQRRVVRWAIAYVAGSWLILEVLGFVAENFGWSTGLVRGVTVLFGVGFFVALVLAWYHGEKGRQRASSWELFIITGLLLVAGVAVAYVSRGVEPRESETGYSSVPAIDPHSIAVLPFVSRSEEGESATVFSEGMHDDVLTQLAKVGPLKVISRTSVMKYRETEKSIPEIAAELGVATVLEGVVQRAGNRVRVNVQLIDAQSDEHLWAETYDEELTAANIFGIQTDLAKKIASALKATLTSEVEARIEARPTESLEAFDLYARGRYILEGPRGFSKEGLEEARELFHGAIQADSSYAPAWASLARVYLVQWSQAHLPPERALPAAWTAVDRALALDPELPEVHSARGALLRAELKFDEAEAAYLRALELNPGSAEEHRRYSLLLNDLGRYHEAAREARRAVELDPLSALNRQGLAASLFFARDWNGVVEESWKLIEMEPSDPIAYYNAGYGHGMKGEHEKAIAALQKARELDPGDAYNTAALAWAHARAGDRKEALALLAEVPEQGAMLKEIAIVYGELGELDLAFEYLNRVAAEDPGMLGELRVDPTADVLRADPRYAEVLRKVGLE